MDLTHPEATDLLLDLLSTGRAVQFVVTGASMRPFLRGGETVVVRMAPTGQIRLGDLLLCHQEALGGSRLVLHRVVAVRQRPGLPALIQTHGDARWAPDEPIPEDQVLGRVCAVLRGPAPGRLVNLETPGQCLHAMLLALWQRGLWWVRTARAALRSRLRARLAEAP